MRPQTVQKICSVAIAFPEVLGRSWVALGGVWCALGVVLGGLGALLVGSCLGRSCGDLKATLGAVNFLIILFIDFGRQKGAQRQAFWEAKWIQNRSQNEVEV